MSTIQDLVKEFTALNPKEVDDSIADLERMQFFYTKKIPQAPPNQARMFSSFVGSMSYAASVIKIHAKLTKKLKEIADEAGIDSQS